jgi:hypothetical protein
MKSEGESTFPRNITINFVIALVAVYRIQNESYVSLMRITFWMWIDVVLSGRNRAYVLRFDIIDFTSSTGCNTCAVKIPAASQRCVTPRLNFFE